MLDLPLHASKVYTYLTEEALFGINTLTLPHWHCITWYYVILGKVIYIHLWLSDLIVKNISFRIFLVEYFDSQLQGHTFWNFNHIYSTIHAWDIKLLIKDLFGWWTYSWTSQSLVLFKNYPTLLQFFANISASTGWFIFLKIWLCPQENYLQSQWHLENITQSVPHYSCPLPSMQPIRYSIEVLLGFTYEIVHT